MHTEQYHLHHLTSKERLQIDTTRELKKIGWKEKRDVVQFKIKIQLIGQNQLI